MTTPPHPPRLLVLSTVVLAVAGIALLSVPHGPGAAAPVVPSTASSAPRSSPVSAAPAVVRPSSVRTTPSATSTASPPPVAESPLPPHGEGVAGDQAVQSSLEKAWPADLPAHDERELLTAGRALLRADATGVGRAQWPGLFPDAGQAVAPAFSTARFRVQAAIARRDGSPDKAVVHLVWAGTDRGGTFTDLRITDWHFKRTASQRGASTWTPQPRT
ncbi:hypothetical protein AB0E08_42010 [Streptomyces sp. NPDC048281]|uniref:hypothetical protein n=1 Tax=Streptomyces sp. NPDC048281 TaxID=3154715 RepID=UPI00341549B6